MKFWLILGIFVVVIGGGGFFFLSILHGGDTLSTLDRKAAMEKALGHAPVLSPTDHTTWMTYQSRVVSFSYPGWATIYTKDNDAAKQQPTVLDSFHFQLSDMHMSSIVSVMNRPGFSQIESEPAVELRLHDTSYQRVGNASATDAQFINTTLGEESFFTLKNGRVYSLVVTGGSDDDRNTIFEKIKNSLQY